VIWILRTTWKGPSHALGQVIPDMLNGLFGLGSDVQVVHIARDNDSVISTKDDIDTGVHTFLKPKSFTQLEIPLPGALFETIDGLEQQYRHLP
jgi:hypothetical protein